MWVRVGHKCAFESGGCAVLLCLGCCAARPQGGHLTPCPHLAPHHGSAGGRRRGWGGTGTDSGVLPWIRWSNRHWGRRRASTIFTFPETASCFSNLLQLGSLPHQEAAVTAVPWGQVAAGAAARGLSPPASPSASLPPALPLPSPLSAHPVPWHCCLSAVVPWAEPPSPWQPWPSAPWS